MNLYLGDDGLQKRRAAVLQVTPRTLAGTAGALFLALSGTRCWAVAVPPNPAPVIEDLTLEELMDVKVTTVTREESTVGQSPAAVFVITQEMIQRSGVIELPELFRMVPGVDVARVSSNQWAISIRGFNSTLAKRLLVQVDGRTVYDPLYSGVYWGGLDYPLEDIERIEVIRGPGGSVWGANAVNGIINIITKPARETQGGLVDAGVGTLDHAFSTVRYGGSSGENGDFRVYAKALDEGGEHPDGNVEHDDWHAASAGFRYDRVPPSGTDFTLSGDMHSNILGQTNGFPDVANPPTFFTKDFASSELQGGNLLARWNHQRNQDSSWTLQAYYDNTQQTISDGLLSEVVNSGDIDFQKQLVWGDRQRIVYGLGYLMQRVRIQGSNFDNNLEIGPSQTANRDTASTFLQDEIKLRQRLTLTLGSKLEHNYYTGLEYEPSVRLLFSPSQKSSAWASVSRAVRTPSLLESDLTVGLLEASKAVPPTMLLFQAAANPNLGSEHVIAYETGYRTQPSKKVSVDAALFFNQYDDLVESQPGTPGVISVPGVTVIGIPLTYVNAENAHSYGFELSTNYDVNSRWKLYGSYSYIDESFHPVAGDDQDITPGSDPRNQVYVRSSHELPHRVHFDLIGRYVDRLPGLAVPSYLTADAQITWKKSDKLEFAVVGQNLLDSYHLEFVGAGNGGDNGSALAVQVQRSVYFKVTRRW